MISAVSQFLARHPESWTIFWPTLPLFCLSSGALLPARRSFLNSAFGFLSDLGLRIFNSYSAHYTHVTHGLLDSVPESSESYLVSSLSWLAFLQASAGEPNPGKLGWG
jgi:hypothetical protein